MPTNPAYDLAFPDLFVDTLSTLIDNAYGASHVTDNYGIQTVVRRPLRPDDPNISVAVFESEEAPHEYEIGDYTTGNAGPSMSRWSILVQVLVKAANEEDAFATRSLILARIRRLLYAQSTINALMVLKDTSVAPNERVTKFRKKRTGFVSGKTNNAFWALAQIEIYFDTEFGS